MSGSTKRMASGAFGLVLALMLLAQNGLADALCVTTWNLEPSAASGASNTAVDKNLSNLQQAAATLKNLNPDVILLQPVRD